MALGLVLAWPAAAQQASTVPASEVREFERAASPALGDDLPYSLYLPPGYGSGDRRYPAVYLLHGKDGNHLQWLEKGHLRETLDRLIAAHKISPMIVVMPDAGNSWYVNSQAVGGPGDYAQAISVDLVNAVDKRFRTRAEPRFRAIGGLSMGGYGALRLGFQQPFRFGAIVALSPALWAGLTSESQLGSNAERTFDGAFGEPPDPGRILARSPLAMIDALAAAPHPPPVFLSVGDQDEYKLYIDTFELFRRMREKGLSVEMRMTGGEHDWTTWAAALPHALTFLDAQFKLGDRTASR